MVNYSVLQPELIDVTRATPVLNAQYAMKLALLNEKLVYLDKFPSLSLSLSGSSFKKAALSFLENPLWPVFGSLTYQVNTIATSSVNEKIAKSKSEQELYTLKSTILNKSIELDNGLLAVGVQRESENLAKYLLSKNETLTAYTKSMVEQGQSTLLAELLQQAAEVSARIEALDAHTSVQKAQLSVWKTLFVL